ncbi:hypothetical protein DPMN_119736 [Dreissena polymorpha]|uniref:Uncharacterized protein n=1 Tax=Dreissena polymorpha TaxID=45954 RepID=A0A9D4GJA7_DREPO|nr:hypothetical protein DPMN_119736 [Dreissena polymorpha]
MQQLEVAHYFCLQRALGLPNLTCSDMVLGLAGVTSIKALINLQKLAFRGSLCHVRTDEPCHNYAIHSKTVSVRLVRKPKNRFHSRYCENSAETSPSH